MAYTRWCNGGVVWRRELVAALVLGMSMSVGVSRGQVTPTVPSDRAEDLKLPAAWQTDTEARTILMSIPGPRGQIVDRYGAPIAQNKIAYYAAVSFPFLESATDSDVLEFARRQIATVNRAAGTDWDFKDEEILSHYENRRWLPLAFTTMLTDEQAAALGPLSGEDKGIVLQPGYTRIYPRGAYATHIVGYVGKTRPLPTGPITNGDPLWPETEGREGLEKSFDEFLQGNSGLVNHIFDADGNKLQEFLVRQPVQGDNIVTALDADLQQFAEDALREHAKRGAFVAMDVKNGDILAMASWPLFDPSVFVPSISQEEFSRLQNDPDIPLFPRAFRGAYPPASTFKVAVALAALETGTIDEWSQFSCPSSLMVGNRSFRNWNKKGEGSLDVVNAIARSCNTWFYQVGRKVGPEPFLSVARRLGLGEPTGIPVAGESAGHVPDGAATGGITANLAIGQGSLVASPLQVAQMMAAVANGEFVPVPRLVLQIQDLNNKIVRSFPPETKNRVELSKESLRLVRKGMWAVVHAGNGTGRRASIEHAEVVGKTGTGQWMTGGQDRRVAWFAGFLPAEDPRYAFATVSEGDLGETMSGGRNAAPMVHDVFTKFYENELQKRLEKPEDEKDETEEAEELASNESGGGTSGSSQASSGSAKKKRPATPRPPAATPVPPPPPPPQEKKGLFGRILDKLRGQ